LAGGCSQSSTTQTVTEPVEPVNPPSTATPSGGGPPPDYEAILRRIKEQEQEQFEKFGPRERKEEPQLPRIRTDL
jgi:hypothetical protein